MTDKEFEDAWIDVCSELRMSMDGVYFEAAVMLAKKAAIAEREACIAIASAYESEDGQEIVAAMEKRSN